MIKKIECKWIQLKRWVKFGRKNFRTILKVTHWLEEEDIGVITGKTIEKVTKIDNSFIDIFKEAGGELVELKLNDDIKIIVLIGDIAEKMSYEEVVGYCKKHDLDSSEFEEAVHEIIKIGEDCGLELNDIEINVGTAKGSDKNE